MNYKLEINASSEFIGKVAVFICMVAVLFGGDLYFYEGYEEIRMLNASIAILTMMPLISSWSFWSCIGFSFIYTSFYTGLVSFTTEFLFAEKLVALFGL